MDKKRREFIKKGAYTAPVIMTLTAMPSFASQGSYRCDYSGENVDCEQPILEPED